MLDLNALQETLRHISGYTTGRVLKKNATSSKVEWAALVASDLPATITNVDYLVGTATSDLSAEIVVGTTPGGELGGTWASPTVDATHSGSAHHAQSHGASDHTDRTRYIPLNLIYNIRTGTYVAIADDAHGSLGGMHIDQADADATFKQIRSSHVPVPVDFSSGMTLNLVWSSSAASNNAVFQLFAYEYPDASTTLTTVLAQSLVAAAPGVANTTKVSSQAFDSAPTVGRLLGVRIDIDTNNASDSNTGTRSLWGAFLSYQADM